MDVVADASRPLRTSANMRDPEERTSSMLLGSSQMCQQRSSMRLRRVLDRRLPSPRVKKGCSRTSQRQPIATADSIRTALCLDITPQNAILRQARLGTII